MQFLSRRWPLNSNPISGKETPALQFERALAHVFVLAVLLYVAFTNISHSTLTIAWTGFSPVEWIYKRNNPVMKEHDFEHGVYVYETTALMQGYRFLYHWLAIEPEVSVKIYIFFEIFLLAGAAYFLASTIFPNSHWILPLLCVLMFVASNARMMDIALWKPPRYQGKMYVAADAFRIIAIACALRQWHLSSWAFISAAILSHPIMGFLGAVCVFSLYLLEPKILLCQRFLYGILSSAATIVVWMFWSIPYGLETVPSETWLRFVHLWVNWHWFPIKMGRFTIGHEYMFIKFLSFTLLFICYFHHYGEFRKLEKRVACGCLAVLLMVIAGIIISHAKTSPTLIKLALHRSSGLFIIMGLVYVVNGLWCEMCNGPVWRKALAVTVLLSCFAYTSQTNPMGGFPIFSSLLLSGLYIYELLFKHSNTWRHILVTTFTFSIIALLLVYYFSGCLQPWHAPGYTAFYGIVALFIGLTFFIIGVMAFNTYIRVPDSPYVVLISLLFPICALSCEWADNSQLHPATLDVAADYLDVQQWASQNTPQDSLFMVDPFFRYSWRAFSQRASFGTPKEWLYSGWIYSSNLAAFEEGKRRFSEYGLQVEAYLEHTSMLPGRLLTRDSRIRYYRFKDRWRQQLAIQYGIDYFVFFKNIPENSGLPIVYENERFTVRSILPPL